MRNLEENFKALAALNAEALKENDGSTIGAISKGVAAHKVKVVGLSNKNRKAWRKKGKSAGATLPISGHTSQASATTGQMSTATGLMSTTTGQMSATTEDSRALGPKEMDQAKELVDQLNKLLH